MDTLSKQGRLPWIGVSETEMQSGHQRHAVWVQWNVLRKEGLKQGEVNAS